MQVYEMMNFYLVCQKTFSNSWYIDIYLKVKVHPEVTLQEAQKHLVSIKSQHTGLSGFRVGWNKILKPVPPYLE